MDFGELGPVDGFGKDMVLALPGDLRIGGKTRAGYGRLIAAT